MKRIIFIIKLLLVFALFTNGQSSLILFTKNKNKKKEIEYDKNSFYKYFVPLELCYNKDAFENDSIFIYSEPTKKPEQLIVKGKFGVNFQIVGEGNDYKILIDADCKIGDTIKIPNTFYININNNNNNFLGPFLLNKYKTSYKPGLLYYDAIKLNELANVTEINDSLYWLKCYILNSYNIKYDDDLSKNNFLKDIFTEIKINDGSVQKGGSEIPKDLLSNFTSSIGGLDVTNIADGFAKFIVKRTKQELSIAFFEKFKETISDTSYRDLHSIFPQTYRTLSAIGEDIYMYEAYIMALRESFEKDLASLPSNLPEIIENHRDYFDQAPELKAALRTAFYMADAIQNKEHPGNIIENYDESILDSERNVKAAFQTLKLFSTSLKSKNNSGYWVSEKEIKSMLGDQILLNIYMGLILQTAKNKKIVFTDKDGRSIKLDSVLNIANDNIQPYKNYLTSLASKTQQLETKIRGLKSIKKDSLLFENYYSVVSSSIDLMKYAINEIPIPKEIELVNNKSKNLKNEINVYFDLIQTGADIAIDVNRRNYSSAIINVVHLYNLTITNWNLSVGEYEEIMKNISLIINKTYLSEIIKSGQIPKDIKLTDRQLKELQPCVEQIYYYNIFKKCNINEDVISNIIRYGSFMSTIVQAESSDEVAAAIEAVALPTGSARIKRETNMNVSLNAYLGPCIGGEYMPMLKTNQWSSSASLTAPIGIAFSWGNMLNGKRQNPPTINKRNNGTLKGGKSLSLFVSIVDIGALVSYRFNDDSTSVSSKITLENIISPGLFFYYGFGKVPISLGIGAQLGPQLRKISATDINVDKDYYFKISASLVVDLPIFNLYTKTDKFKRKKTK